MSGKSALAIPELKPGDVIAFPTETFFGIGCSPESEDGVNRLIELKSRPEDAGFPLIITGPEWIEKYIAESDDMQVIRLRLQQKFWPGPLTIVFSGNEEAKSRIRPEVFGPGFSLAVRVSPDPIAQALAATFGGALISTSANPRGKQPQKTAARVKDYFPKIPIIDGPCGGATKPSSIVDVRSWPLKILREGEVMREQILREAESAVRK